MQRDLENKTWVNDTQSHMIKVNPKLFAWGKCDKSFHYFFFIMNSHISHKSIHQEGPYICDNFGKTLTIQSLLKYVWYHILTTDLFYVINVISHSKQWMFSTFTRKFTQPWNLFNGMNVVKNFHFRDMYHSINWHI